jgi:hypothetical protein
MDRWKRLPCLALAFSLGAAGAAAANEGKVGAEYAVRWDVAEGGPKTTAETLKLLRQEAGETEEYSVVYFNVKAPADAPPGFAPILQQQTRDKKVELVFNYRGRRKLASWKCPLPSANEMKAEIHESFAANATNRAHSYSCKIESDKPIEPPAALAASKPCTSKMIRTKAGNLEIEYWELPNDLKVIEVSRNGAPAKKDRDAFRREVVSRLKGEGVKPLERGMADLGKGCR